MTGCGAYTFGRWAWGISQWRVIGTPAIWRVIAHRLLPRVEIKGAWKRRQHHELREGQPRAIGNVGCGLERGGRSLGSPKMNEPRTWTPWWRNVRKRVTSASPVSLNPLYTSLRPSGVTASTPTSAPLMLARRIAVEERFVLGGLHGDLREEHHV